MPNICSPSKPHRLFFTGGALALVLVEGWAVRPSPGFGEDRSHRPPAKRLRVATFNASLNRGAVGQLQTELSVPGSAQPSVIAEIIQRVQPDVLLINEFDFDATGASIRGFLDNYLAVSQNGAPTVDYPFVFVAPSNTGVDSGFDLDNDGGVGGPGDAFGFGFFEGQFGMVLLSKVPILASGVRTFQRFRWKDMPTRFSRPSSARWTSTVGLFAVSRCRSSSSQPPTRVLGFVTI